jgi:hypothetical protein
VAEQPRLLHFHKHVILLDMGEASLNKSTNELIIHSILYFYGNAADAALASRIAQDIMDHWNEPRGVVKIKQLWYAVKFHIEGIYDAALAPETVWYNDDPRLNFFRVEDYAAGDISFVDGLNSNTGYFKKANLVQTSTTAAHEYGHTIGLDHPAILDIRGKGAPGIMYPRGTLVDPPFQYDPNAQAGKPGGTLNPVHRRVLQSDINDLGLHRLSFNEQGKATVGAFSSFYHQEHVL